MSNNKITLSARINKAWHALQGKSLPAKAAFGSRGIAAAETTRLLADWLATRMQRDDEIKWSIPALRARARDLENNDPTTKHYLRLLAVNVIGPNGMRLQSQIRNNDGKLNKPFNDKIEEAWLDWCYTPTRDGRQDFVSLCMMLLKAVARDGEVFVRIWRNFERNDYGFALEPLDPALIDENYNRAAGNGLNEIRLGVEIDSDGRPVAYHGWSSEQRLTSLRDRQRISIPANQIIHLFDPERVGQTRGISWMASVMVNTKMLSGYIESELVAARVAAAKMGFFQKKADAGGAIPDDAAFTVEANPGTFGILPEGYEVASFSPDHPSTAFGDFVKASLRSIATGHGVSYNALANDLENVNYSSIRAGLIIERDQWRSLQRWWICAFMRPVYLEWLNSALLYSAITLDSRDVRKFLKYRFIPRGWAWVDPLKDAQAGIESIQNGLASRTSLLAERGDDLETILEELAEESRLAEQYGVEIDTASDKSEPADASAVTSTDTAGNGSEDVGDAPDQPATDMTVDE